MLFAKDQFAKDPIILPAEDRNRMSRLYEEVWIRLEEMAMITARTLKLNASRGSDVKFCPLAAGAEVRREAVELFRTTRGHGCYDYREGACFEFEGAGLETSSTKEEQTI
jgi:hypothetical protein